MYRILFYRLQLTSLYRGSLVAVARKKLFNDHFRDFSNTNSFIVLNTVLPIPVAPKKKVYYIFGNFPIPIYFFTEYRFTNFSRLKTYNDIFGTFPTPFSYKHNTVLPIKKCIWQISGHFQYHFFIYTLLPILVRNGIWYFW